MSGNGRPERRVTVTGPRMRYMVEITTKVPVDRGDMCREIVDNVYGPVTAIVVSSHTVEPKKRK